MNETIKKIDNYLQLGGMFNPEEMEHHKVRDLLLEARNDLEKMLQDNQKLAKIVKRVYVDIFPDTYFISGEMGDKDQNGLPHRIEICPAYGVDWVQIYERTDYTIGGMGS